MKTKWFVILSLGLNVALAAWIVIPRSGPLPVRDESTLTHPLAPPATPMPPVVTSPVASAARTNFHWRQVESTDYVAYITNLRAIGCPEETIRDIIMADVTKLFAPRYAALAASAPELSWWGRFDKRKPVRAALAAALRALNDEKKALLVRLLGNSAGAEFAIIETSAAAVREQSSLAFLPESKQAVVHDLVARYQSLREWSEAQWKGLPSDERDAREKELLAARTRELAALLTPEELREFSLRDSLASDTLRQEFGRGDLTEAEFRKLFDLYDDFQQKHPKVQAEDMKRLQEDYAAALGPDRLTDLKRQNDRTWRGLQDLAAEQNLTPDALRDAYSIKQEFQGKMVEAVRRMFADPEKNPQPVRDLAAEMDRRLEPIIGVGGIRHLDRIDALPRLVVETDGKRTSYSFSRGSSSD